MIKVWVRERSNGQFDVGIGETKFTIDGLDDLVFISGRLQESALQVMLRKLEQKER